ncbi:CotH kinase family protein [Verrucomicrobiota bacterium sgz303538]
MRTLSLHVCLLTLLLLGGSLGARASVVARYDAGLTGTAPDPSSAAGGLWAAGAPTSDSANFLSAGVSPDGATGFNAWRMLDNSTASGQFITWNKSLTPQQHSDAAAYGWRLSARLRVVDPVAGNAGANSVVLLYGNNASKRWIVFFDIDTGGNLVATLVGGPTITLTGVNAAAQSLHELVFNPATNSVEYIVNGVSKASGYTGTTGAFNGLQWGTGSSSGRGDGYWNNVTFTIADPTTPSSPPIVVTQPQSQSVELGGSVTFSGAFTGASSYQWYKDTLPISGGTSPTHTLNNVSTADSGDYWLRATNANGKVETTTAALIVLTPGGSLELSEFVAENDNGLRDADGERNDWLEIHNSSTNAVSTEGWSLTDNPLLPRKWALPAKAIPAGGFLVVFASGKNRTAADAELHTNFAIQNATGYLALVRPDGSVATAYTSYPEQYADIAYGLTSTGSAKYLRVPTPGAPNVDGITAVRPKPEFTPAAGSFSGTLNVEVISTLAGGSLRYTTDGQLPTFDSPAYTTPIALSASAQVRAAVLFPNERYGASATASYLRLGSDVTSFTSPLPIVVLHNFGAGAVPGVSSYGPSNDGSGVIEVPMQPHALTIFKAATGSSSFASPAVTNTRAGLRLRGSSSFNFARKSYSLETWSELDEEGRDEALLGLPADSDWVLYGPDPGQFDDVLIHNSFIYELARQSGFNAPRTKFVEVFLNTSGGDITMANSLGLYLLVEKPKRGKQRVSFDPLNADGTAGGWMISVDRMDSLPPGSDPVSTVPRHFHTAGPDAVLQTADDNPRGFQGPSGGSGLPPPRDDMPNFYHSFFNFESPSGWSVTNAQRAPIQSQLRAFDAALYSLNFTNPTLGYARFIDSRNWAQHLALHCFAKNQDAVVLSTFLYRETPTAPIKFGPIWDFDRAFNKNATNGSASANTTWAHDRLYYPRLLADPEFSQAYIDAWQAMRRGAFSDANMRAVVDAQVGEITSAVAARSGTTAAAWNTNVAAFKTWLTDRAAALDAFYTQPAVFAQNGGSVPTGFTLTITAPVGSIYYTTDGTDPRTIGGGIRAGANLYTGAVPITSTATIIARVKNGVAWSGMTAATFYPPQDLGALRVTEIMYNPPGAPGVDGDEFEFLELQNTGTVTLDLSGLSFSGITFTFNSGAKLDPGAYCVLVRNPAQFTARYPGVAYHGVYAGKLDNSGETLALLRGAETVWSFEYGDSGEWPVEADGGGMSLQRVNLSTPGYDAAMWTAAVPDPGAALPLSDSDDDGLPDYWETLYGLNDAADDLDGDGASNLSEFIAGTNPRNNNSVLRLAAANTSGGVQLQFVALAGHGYTVQTTEDLQTWEKLLDVPVSAVTRSETLTVAVDSMKKFFRIITPAVAGVALIAPAAGADNVALDPVFSDHMVLQRDTALPVWGTAAPGNEITVSFGGDSAATIAAEDGRWFVRLPAKSASKVPRELKVRANGQERLTVSDVLVGEVWLCAGQSNMEFRTNQEATWVTEQRNASLSNVRLRNMGYAGQGYFATEYPATLVSRQTPHSFYNASSWVPCDASSAAPFSAVGYFFGKEIRNALDVPVGLINCSVGGSPAEAWVRREALVAAPSLAKIVSGNWLSNGMFEPWCTGRAQVQLGASINSAPGDDVGANHSFKPSFLWDSGPGRIAPYAIRGVLWYQGESNALSHIAESGVANPKWRVDQHEQIFPVLVQDWRKKWGQGDFPFLVCQLSSISTGNYASHFWPEFRDYQRRATSLLPNMGLAVTSDIGNSSNVHPTNKHDVGKRLANWARRYVYNDASVLACPLPTSAKRNGSAVLVAFNDAGPALATADSAAPASFELAGVDGVFFPAEATISGASVVVSSTSVPTPVNVRYAWQPYSSGNLVNFAGLPASTFLLTVTP